MAITNFIPTIWSENLLTSLDKQYIGVAHCNREYEGDIQSCGGTVKICGVGEITVADYRKNTDMFTPQVLDDTATQLVINRAKYFNFLVDDVDKTQSSPKLMDAAMRNAAAALADVADQFVFSEYDTACKIIHFNTDSGDKLLDSILKCRETLYINGVISSEDIVIEISPEVATFLIKEMADKLSYNNSIIETGYIGSIAGCKVFVSNNIFKSTVDIDTTHYCLIRSTRAIAFAEQLSEVEAYRPEKRFADAVKGLHLYGVKTVYPNEMVTLAVYIPGVEA